MRVLIAGGSGFIGHALIKAFVQRQYTVTVLSRRSRTSSDRYVTYKEWNGKDMPMGVGLYDIIINLSGASIAEKKWTPDYKKELLASRIETTDACVRYINKCQPPPKVFLNASAVGYYGGNNEAIVDETGTAAADFMGQLCQQWEQATQGANCRTVCMRIGVVIGKEGGALQQMLPIYRKGLGATFGNGSQGFSWIHIEDMVKAVLFLIDNNTLQGAVNMVAPQVTTQKMFSDRLAASLGRRAFFRIPVWALQLGMGERSILFWGGQKVIPKVLTEAGFSFGRPTLDQVFAE